MSVQPYLGPKSIGDRSLGRLFSGPVVVQEKVDGSQFSFQIRETQKADILTSLLAQYKTTARWQKAVQHLKEQGALAGTTKDIGPLLKELASDIHRECAEEIRAALFAHFWPQVHRGVADGFAQWYKEKLLEEALPTETATETPADEKEAA